MKTRKCTCDVQNDKQTGHFEDCALIQIPQSQHTPTPWNVQTAIKEFVPIEQGGGLKVRIFDATGKRVASMNVGGNLEDAKANAAFIVRAVNSYEELLNVVRRAQHAMNSPNDIDLWEEAKQDIANALVQDKAIAKAEGK